MIIQSSEVLSVTGLLTMGAVLALFKPSFILKWVFGVIEAGVATKFLVQHWGLLVFLVGTLLFFASYHPEVQIPILIVAATEKCIGGGLILLGPLRRRPIALGIVAADSVMAILYLLILVTS